MPSTRRFSMAITAGISMSLLATLVATAPVAADARRPSSSKSTFRLNPAKDRVDVTVSVTVSNRLPDRVSMAPCPGDPRRRCRNTTRFYIDSFGYFPVQIGGRGLKFSGPGVKARVDHKNSTFNNYIVEFAPIYQGGSRTFKATYYLPAAGPRSPNRTRITDAYAHFCWHGPPTDRGSVKAYLPPSYEPSTQHRGVVTKRSKKAVLIRAKRSTQMGRFHACTDSFKPHKLLRTETISPSGQIVSVEGWPEDPDWTEAISKGVQRALPELETITGTPVPGDEIVVRQVAAQALGGYAGDFSDKSGQIRVGEKYDDALLVAHELAHAWYNRGSAKDTWLIEGHAEWMAHQSNRRTCGPPGDYPGKGKPKLRDWQYLGVNSGQRLEDVVDYQYAAACYIVQLIEKMTDLQRMADISQALLERTPKYGGSTGKKAPKPDWREWLDAVDEIGLVPAGNGDLAAAQELLVEFGVVKRGQLKGRAKARSLYHEALAGSWGAYMPVVVRDLMDDWRFDKAVTALGVSERVVALALRADETTGEEIHRRVGPVLREAGTVDELRELKMKVATDPLAFLPLPVDVAPAEVPDDSPPPAGPGSSAR